MKYDTETEEKGKQTRVNMLGSKVGIGNKEITKANKRRL